VAGYYAATRQHNAAAPLADFCTAAYTSVWFWQNLGDHIRLVGFYQNSGEAMPHYVSEVDKLYKANDWSREDAIDWFPHDAKVHDLLTGKTRLEQLLELGFKPRIVPKMQFADGVNAVRTTLPRCYFDQTTCSEGITVLKNYRKKWIEEKGIWSDQPFHNWASHGADAFRYLCVAQRDLTPPVEDKTKEDFCSLPTLGAIRDDIIRKNKQNRRFLRR
jgi:phage terminase large subunit